MATDATATEIPFEIAHDPADIEEASISTFRARIVSTDDNLPFIDDTSISAITRDAPSQDVEVPVTPVAASSLVYSEAPSE